MTLTGLCRLRRPIMSPRIHSERPESTFESRPRGLTDPEPQFEGALDATDPTTLLPLQRSAGNRAVQRLVSGRKLQRQGPVAPPVPAPPVPAAPAAPTQVSNQISDGPFGWWAQYEVSFVGTECRLNINVKLVPDAGVSAADVARIKTQTTEAVTRMWDRRFIITDTSTHKHHALRVGITYVNGGEHVAINLHPGSGGANRRNWYVDGAANSRAHEIGHQLGLKDEYIDARAPSRATATSPGVFTDHSIMGAHYSEGPALAEGKARHAHTIGGHIAGSTGMTLTGTRPTVQVKVKSTEDWTGADEVYVKATGPGGVFKSPVKSLNDGQSHDFAVSTVPFGDFSKPVTIDVYDEDWPDRDDLIVRMSWSPPFGDTKNTKSFDEANYAVTAKLE
jgi:hypothetical protein